MNQRDRELLNKQFAWMRPAPRQISLKLGMTCAIFLAGLGVSSMLVLQDPNARLTTSVNASQMLLASYSAPRAH
jgi:hypothetical protein